MDSVVAVVSAVWVRFRLGREWVCMVGGVGVLGCEEFMIF